MKIARVKELHLAKMQQEQDIPMLYCSIYRYMNGEFEYNDIEEVELPVFEKNYIAYLNDAVTAHIVEVLDEQTSFMYTFVRRYCVNDVESFITTDVFFFDDEDETYHPQLVQATKLAWEHFDKFIYS